jgi:nicotinate-nucleotide adenylyltransferase
MNALQKPRLGVLGGSFDPVHNGHITLAQEAKKKFKLDRVIFIPAFQSPHKTDQIPTDAFHRVRMLELALQDEPGFQISTIELDRKGLSYTIDTIDALKATHDPAELFLILGIDAFKTLDTWKDSSRLIETCHLLVSTRPGHNPKTIEPCVQKLIEARGSFPYSPARQLQGNTVFQHQKTGTEIVFFDLTPTDISSRQIRKLIADNQELKNLLPRNVENYIIENRLYRAPIFTPKQVE